MDREKLEQFYDTLKAELDRPTQTNTNMLNVGNGKFGTIESPGATVYRNMASKECEKLKDNCRKHIILDIYCKILPLDDDFKDANPEQMAGDVDAMLANKGMSATQYLTSASEKTQSPLVEYVLRMTDLIGREYMREANEILDDAKEKGIEIPAPEAPNPEEDDNTKGQIVDITNDSEYQKVIEDLKRITGEQVVDAVSKILKDKKEENEIKFEPKPVADVEAETESTLSVGLDYIQNRLMKEGVEVPMEMGDEMIALAIRESTLNQIDRLFNMPMSSFNEFATRIRFGKGVLINESAIGYLKESAKSPDEVNKVIDNAKKESEEKINSNLKASDVLNAKEKEEEEKKKENQNN